jgi:hypothetical protein
LAAVSAEKAVLRMIAAESANFVTFDIAHLLRLFAAALRRRHHDKIDKRSYYSESGANWWITSGNFFARRPVAIVATR